MIVVISIRNEGTLGSLDLFSCIINSWLNQRQIIYLQSQILIKVKGRQTLSLARFCILIHPHTMDDIGKKLPAEQYLLLIMSYEALNFVIVALIALVSK